MTDASLVDEWLSRNRPRRFERGESATPDALKSYLAGHGYELLFTGWRGGQRAIVRTVGARGRPPTMDMRDLLIFVDQFRVADGLEPILAELPEPEHYPNAGKFGRTLKKVAA